MLNIMVVALANKNASISQSEISTEQKCCNVMKNVDRLRLHNRKLSYILASEASSCWGDCMRITFFEH